MVDWNNKEEVKEYHRKYWYKRRQKIIDYLGGLCARCGTSQDLEFDHINPEEKLFDISAKCTLATSKDEIDKCQLLCKSCHLKKTVDEKETFTHGTQYGFQKIKCNCQLCWDAKKKHYEAKNQKRRKTDHAKGPYSKNPPHGTSARYSRKCRCELCRKANSDKEKARRAKLKEN